MWSFKFKSAFITKQSNIKKAFCSKIFQKRVEKSNKETLERFKTMKEEFSSKNDNQLYEYANDQRENLLHKIDIRYWSNRFKLSLNLESKQK